MSYDLSPRAATLQIPDLSALLVASWSLWCEESESGGEQSGGVFSDFWWRSLPLQYYCRWADWSDLGGLEPSNTGVLWFWELNPRPLATEARIVPLDQIASDCLFLPTHDELRTSLLAAVWPVSHAPDCTATCGTAVKILQRRCGTYAYTLRLRCVVFARRSQSE